MKVHYKMSFATASIILIFISIYGFVTINRELSQEQERFLGKIKKNNLIVKNTLEEALWNLNDQVIERNMEFFLEDSEITELILFDNFSSFKKSKNENPRDEYHIVQKFTLKRDEFKIGELEIVYSNEERRRQIDKRMYEIVQITLLIIITIFALNYYILKFLNSPIDKLLSAFKDVEKGNLAKRLDFKSKDEFNTIGTQFNRMVKTLEQDREILISKEAELKKAKNNAENYSEKLEKLNEELEEIIGRRTKQLKIEKQRAESANKAKDKFLANISHEMRTPLTPIIGFSKGLLKKLNDDASKSKLEIIRNSGERLLSLTNELLKFSKIEKYEITLEYEQFNIKNFFNNLHHEKLNSFKEKGLNFDIFIDDDIPETTLSDKMKLYEIFTNLLENALKYTKEGFVMIELSNNKDYLIIDLYDSGIGIPQEKLSVIFDAFEQVDNKKEGIGLGLNIVKRFIEALNGKIKIESSVDNGSHFNIQIPLLEKDMKIINTQNVFKKWTYDLGEKRYILTLKALLKLPIRIEDISINLENRDMELLSKSLHSLIGVSGNYHFTEVYNYAKKMYSLLESKNSENEILALLRDMKNIVYSLPFKQIFFELIQNSKFKILIAEDIKENQELIKDILEFSSLEFNCVSDGLEALNEIKKNKYDVILMDIQMPELSGDEVLKKIKTDNIDLKTPIIALTAQALSNDRYRYLELGFDDYISKPIDELLLYSKLGEVFRL